jgi:hypothetical protein
MMSLSPDLRTLPALEIDVESGNGVFCLTISSAVFNEMNADSYA